jgi:hypothetical protein
MRRGSVASSKPVKTSSASCTRTDVHLEEVAVDEGACFGTCLGDDGSVNQHQREDNHDDAGGPSDYIEAPGVYVHAHQVAAVDKN